MGFTLNIMSGDKSIHPTDLRIIENRGLTFREHAAIELAKYFIDKSKYYDETDLKNLAARSVFLADALANKLTP